MKLLLIILITLLLNLPFGMYRVKTKRFSLAWFASIHIPIPFVYWLRIKAGYGIKAIPLMVLMAVIGQVTGGKIREK